VTNLQLPISMSIYSALVSNSDSNQRTLSIRAPPALEELLIRHVPVNLHYMNSKVAHVMWAYENGMYLLPPPTSQEPSKF
jgi:hypothetical protein